MRLTPLAYEIGLADRRRFDLMQSKRRQRDSLIAYCAEASVRPETINPYLESIGSSTLTQGVRLQSLILRPELNIASLAQQLPELAAHLDTIETERRDEIIEAAEILIKYSGYIDRERQLADKLGRLEDLRLDSRLDYSSIKALSTEARMKLDKIRPATIGQASRISGVSPSDISILLLLMGR